MKRYIPLVVCFVMFLAGQALAFELTILHVNDSHSYLETTEDTLTPGGEKTYVKLGAWARLTSAVSHVRRERENVALLHAGDAVQGDLYYMEYGGKPEMEFLDRLDFDAYVLGNHEFDKGAGFLAGFLGYADVPVLGANMDASGEPKLAEKVNPYVVMAFGEEKVGVIGLVTKDTAFLSSPGPGVTFSDEAETASKYIAELEAQGIDKIILLTHVGLERDKQLAAAVAGVDVIVGGHSHSLIADPEATGALGQSVEDTYPVVVKGVDGNDVHVVTAWKWGRVLGRLDLVFDDKGRVTAAEGKPVMLVADDFKRKNEAGKKVQLSGVVRQAVLDELAANPVAAVVAEDAPAAEFLAPYTKGLEAMRSEVIGKAVKALPHIRVPGVTKGGFSLPHGSLLAPLVAQSMLDKIATTGERADIALVNGGGVRDSIPRGKITVGMAYTLMPFANTLYTLDVTGAQVKAALEYGVTRSGGAFPYVAGMRYTADMTRPEGERIVSVEVWADESWAALDMQRTYGLVVSSYLAGGGDGYAMLKDGTNRYDTGFADSQAFIEFVMKKKKLVPPKSTGVTYVPAR